MKSVTQLLFAVLCLAVHLLSAPARAAGVLDVVPGDALAVAVVHDLKNTSAVIDDVARLVQAPAPDVLTLAQQATGMGKGIDEGGDMAFILTSFDPMPKFVILAPVANFEEFVASFGATAPASGAVEVQLSGRPTLVGRKGNYAAIAPASDRDNLERYLADTTSLASDAELAAWLDANQASVVMTSRGAKALLPKLVDGVRMAQAGLQATAGANGQQAADALGVYIALFNAAQNEVSQLALGVRVDAARTVALVKRVQFVPDGAWAKAVADVPAASGDPLAGLPAGPFVFAMGGFFPKDAMTRLMNLSVNVMKSNPAFNLSDEQAERYVELSTKSMAGAKSMAMVVGVPPAGTGLYGNTTAVMTFDDPQKFLDEYEKSLPALRELAEETQSPAVPLGTVQRVQVGDVEALEVTMEMPKLPAAAAGGPDMQKMMQFMAGPDGKLKVYLAAADDHAVVMAYTSPELLKTALAAYKSKAAGISSDAQVAQTAAALPAGSQVVAYFSINGVANVIKQFAATMSEVPALAIPNFADAPPIGMAAKVSASGVEGSLVVPAGALKAIGAVKEARGGAAR